MVQTKLYPNQYGHAARAMEECLRKLDLGYIDILLLHHPASNDVSAYRAIEQAIRDGKVRSAGISCYYIRELDTFLPQVDLTPGLVQNAVHPYYPHTPVVRHIQEADIPVQAWYPLGHGDKTLLEEPLFAQLGQKYGKTSAQVILRWHIQDGNIVIPGSKNPGHIRDNFTLFDFALTDQEMAQIAALDRQKNYYTSTPELLRQYVAMVPPVDSQK